MKRYQKPCIDARKVIVEGKERKKNEKERES